MSATVHPPQANQKFWPLKKFALGKSAPSNQQKASSVRGEKNNNSSSKTTKAANTPTTTTSKQQQDSASSMPQQQQQQRRGTKGDTIKQKSSTTTKGGNATTMTRQKSKQRPPLPQQHVSSSTKESKQSSSRRSSTKPAVKKEKEPVDDMPAKNNTTLENPPSDVIPPITLSPVTTTATSPTILSSNDSNTSSPPMVPTIYEPAPETIKPVRSRPQQHKLLRPTSCTSLRQVALHQALYPPPSPKSKHIVYDPSDRHQQYLIRRSSTFHHQQPICSSYRRFSESTLEDSPTTPDSNEEEEDDAMGYVMDGYGYDDDDQTLFSNSLLSLDTKLGRQRRKRPMSMICPRPPPDAFYTTDPSSIMSLPQQQQPQHPHPGVVTINSAGDLCVPPPQDGYYTEPSSPRSQQAQHRPLYLFSDADTFNKKHPKRHSMQQQQHDISSKRHHLSMDLLKQELESERAVVHALQRQKEAYNKDITYLCQNVDHLTKDGNEWKAKYKQEKAEKEKSRHELSIALDNFNEATEQIKQLANEKQQLRDQLTQVHRQLELEKRTPSFDPTSILGNHDQQQIQFIQSTMEKLLRLDIFRYTHDKDNDKPLSPPVKTTTRATSMSAQRKPSSSTRSSRSSSSKPSATKHPSTTTTTTLDDQLQCLLQEKELLQAEYSKIPVSGSNAICRRRREDLEARLDEVDSKMRKIRLKLRRGKSGF